MSRPAPCGAGRLCVACCPDRSSATAGPILLGLAAVCAGGRQPAREIATREPSARSGRSRSPARPCRRPPVPRQLPPVSSTPAVRRHHRPPTPRPGLAGPAAASHRWLVVCVLPGQALCGLCGACAEHEEACDCCRQYERADAHVHKGAGCLSDKEPFKQPGEQEETEEAPHASRCACHQLL